MPAAFRAEGLGVTKAFGALPRLFGNMAGVGASKIFEN